MTKFEAINWNQIENKIDYSAWSRLNDFIWEPERIPVFNDKKEFQALEEEKQIAILRAFAALSFLSSLQVKYGDDAVKKDASTPQEISVFSALSYLEAIANKGYSNVIQALANPLKTQSYFDWINGQEHMQEIAEKYIDIYQNGTWWQKKIALSFMEMAIYHSFFYASLKVFGEGKLVRTAEIVKLAIRTTSFNAMYPGVKFRLEASDLSESEQKEYEEWTSNFIKEISPIIEDIMTKEYSKVGWSDEAIKYYRYSVNKDLMNLGFATPFEVDSDDLSDDLEKGLIKSADFEDFFYYSNKNTLTSLNKIN